MIGTDTNAVLGEKVGGIQLALFEIIWPSFVWINQIYIGCAAERCMIYAIVNEVPAEDEWRDYERLMGEILDAALSGTGCSYELTKGTDIPVSGQFELLMSQSQFEALAKEFAPWRLEAGR